jgi:hypothetical protein
MERQGISEIMYKRTKKISFSLAKEARLAIQRLIKNSNNTKIIF